MTSNPALRRSASALAIAIAILAICAFAVYRVTTVNNAAPKGETITYVIGDEIPFPAAWQTKDEESGSTNPSASLTVLGCTILSAYEIQQIAPNYEANSPTEKVVLARILVKNGSSEISPSPLPFLSFVENAWGNGVDAAALTECFNPGLETLQLEPGTQQEVIVPTSASETQFGFNADAWNKFGTRGLRLHLNCFPDEIYVSLDPENAEDFGEIILVDEAQR